MKIASICPSNTELLHYLGLSSSIIGVDNYSDWPPQVDQLPRLGPDLDINMDQVEALEPDLVLASLSVPGMEKNVERLQARGIPHIVLNPNTLEEIGQNILQLGEATGEEKRARAFYDQYTERLESYHQLATKVKEKKRMYWEWWPKPVFTPGGHNWLTEISRLAGAENIFADQAVASYQTDWEEVKQREPDIVALVWVGVQQKRVNPKLVYDRPGWKELAALQQNQVHVLDEPLFCRPSPRLITGLAKLASLLHPEIFPVYHEGEDVLIKYK